MKEHFFSFRKGVLHMEEVDLRTVAQTFGTPVYCYSQAVLEQNFQEFHDAFSDIPHVICYAMKANSNQSVLHVLAARGAGVDIVSGGELHRALAAGISAERMVFSGVGKTREEMSDALDARIRCFNIESESELQMLSEVAESKGCQAPISIRVNPDVQAGGHAKISTGKSGDKFGIPITCAKEVYAHAANLPHIQICGVDMHIGSQITQPTPFADAAKVLRDFTESLLREGYPLRHVDFGGGLGIAYEEGLPSGLSVREYAEIVKSQLADLGLTVILEPGRAIVGNAGVMLTSVLHFKATEEKNFLIVDAAMNDLIRPTLYNAYHEVIPVCSSESHSAEVLVDVVGPVCESGDFLALGRSLPRMESGDLLAVMDAGAYGAVKSSNYNSRPLIPEVLIHEDRVALVRIRETWESAIAREPVAAWLKSSP